MSLNRTDDQRQAIKEHGNAPVYLVDATTNETFVLLRASLFEKVKPLFEQDEADPRELAAIADEVMREDWADPAMDAYDNYDAHRSQCPGYPPRRGSGQ